MSNNNNTKAVSYFVSYERGAKDVGKRMTRDEIEQKACKHKWAKGALRAANDLDAYAEDPTQSWCTATAVRFGPRLLDIVSVRRYAY